MKEDSEGVGQWPPVVAAKVKRLYFSQFIRQYVISHYRLSELCVLGFGLWQIDERMRQIGPTGQFRPQIGPWLVK